MICTKIPQAQSPAILPSNMLIGLTGGIGCGKSTAARIFEEHGFCRVDSDEQIQRVVLSDPKVIQAIAGRFGPAAIRSDGTVDRGQVARTVFVNDVELRWLEELLHPRLFAHWRVILAERFKDPWVFEVPLLFEKRLENWFDFTICVATSSAHQLARLAERGMSQALAEQRISKQLPLAQKLELADFVLLNDGSPTFLREQIAGLVSKLRVRC